ncbi:lysophospholipid acyltransferase family protein [Sulfurospirillum arcachonense]|uniref:lysophospholipid acyltransferase family protein n=1 Tax=Sulfurospirillum arcachonense TaxID=57666 RepID=UPI0004B59BF2|nr:lysophospholipid acyltransferase family protein [Sulfurospirillum arcachonense]
MPPLLYILLYFIYFTCKKRYHFDRTKVLDTPSVFVFWHGELLMLTFGYMDYRRSKNVDTMVSRHHDGEIATRLLNLLGAGAIRGSSSKGAMQALKSAFKSLNLGRDVAITPDGPKGPRYSVADGAVVIAQKKNVPIVTMNCKATKAWRLNSWDKFSIPKPFCTLDFYYSDPFYITEDNLNDAKEKIKERLMKNAF